MAFLVHRRKAFATGGGGYLLDTYGSAAAAYSLRVLSSSFASADLILCRRASDSAELGFTAAEITDGTLATWASGTDAFVKTWYDQSGNTVNITQATAAYQPQIVNSGSVFTNGTDPIVRYPGTNQVELLAVFGLTNSSGTVFLVYDVDSTEANGMMMSFDGGNVHFGVAQNGSTSAAHAGCGSPTYRVDGSALTSPDRDDIHTNCHTGTRALCSITGLNFSSTSSWDTGSLGPFVYPPTNSYSALLDAFEFIVYNSDESSNLSGIEGNIATAYGITI